MSRPPSTISIIFLGFLAASGLSLLPASAAQPSFNCSKASTADEVSICASDQLSELDNLIGHGFYYFHGVREVINFTAQSLRLRHACGSDVNCIAQRQIDVIRMYQSLGAPIQLPGWAVAGAQAPTTKVQYQDDPILQSIVLNRYRLFSRFDSRSLVGFDCGDSDYDGMQKCSHDRNGTQQYFVFERDSKRLHYIFQYQEDRSGLLKKAFQEELARLSRVFGTRSHGMQATLPGDLYPSLIVYWGPVKLIPLSDNERQKYVSGISDKGYLIDYQLRLSASARQGYPIFYFDGGPGYIINFHVTNEGVQRIGKRLVDPAAFEGYHGPTVAPAPQVEQPTSEEVATKAEQLLRDRLTRGVAVANDLIAEAFSFLKFDQQNPKGPDIAADIATLNSTVKAIDTGAGAVVKADDLSRLQAATTSLSDILHGDKRYAEFTQERTRQQVQENDRRLNEAQQLAASERNFLRSYITQNPTSEASAAFVADLKELDSVLGSLTPSLSQLVDLTQRVKGKILEHKLGDEFAGSVATPSSPNRPDQPGPVVVAKQLVDKASAFLNSDPTNPNTSGIAEAIASLNAALKTGEPPQILAATSALSATLHEDKAFEKFVTDQGIQRSEESALHLSETLKLAKQQQLYVRSYIAQHPSDANSAVLIGYLKRLDIVVAEPSPTLDELRSLTDEADTALAQANLQGDFLAFRTATPAPKEKRAPRFQQMITDRTRFLLEGDLDDVVVMFNSSTQSPHAVKNLRGDVVFGGGEASLCFGQGQPDPALIETVRSALAAYKLDNLSVNADRCPADQVLEYDVIAVRRGDLLREDPEYVSTVVREVQSSGLSLLAQKSSSEIAAAARALQQKQQQLSSEIANGSIDGYGFLILTAISSPVICANYPSSGEGHQAVITNLADHLRDRLGMNPVTKLSLFGTSDDAFAAVQRAQCGAVYGSAKVLRELMAGLDREQIPYVLDTEWISQPQVDGAQSDAVRSRQLEDQQQLDRGRKEDEARLLQGRQLKDQNGQIANAASAELANEAFVYVEGHGSQEFAARFPVFVSWYSSVSADHWELTTRQQDLLDYGRVSWKGRQLEAVVTEVKIGLRNAILGEYKTGCYMFGQVIDKEFEAIRDPVAAGCEDIKAISSWKQNNQFQSQWVVN